MNAGDKKKFIVIASVVAFLILGALVVYATLPSSNEDNNELSVRVQDEGEVTVEDMMKSGSDKKTEEAGLMSNSEVPSPPAQATAGKVSYSGAEEIAEDNQEVLRLQKQLRTNRTTSYSDGYSAPTYSGSYASRPAPKPKAYSGSSTNIYTYTNPPIETKENPVPKPTKVENPVTAPQKPKGRFFSSSGKKMSQDNAIAAVVHGDQTVTSGATLKMHLLQDMVVDGVVIPKNSFVYGVVSFNGERMSVKVSAIRLHNSIYPVKLDVFDRDGIKGIYVPGSVKSDVKADVTDAGASEITPTGIGVIGGVVRAVTSAGKSILSKKNRVQKASIRTNYKIYLQWAKE